MTASALGESGVGREEEEEEEGQGLLTSELMKERE